MKKILLVVIVTLLLVCCFAGCSQSYGANGQNNTGTNSERQMEGGEDMDLTKISFVVDGKVLDVSLEDNVATRDLYNALKSGDIKVNMSRYGGFEQVGSLGRTLKSSDRQMSTNPGDVVLYNSNQIVMFFGNNSWSYTKLGHINMSKSELETLLDKSGVQLVISLG